VAPRIDPAQAFKVVDVSGLYVTPGLIDLHVHVYTGTGEKRSYAGDNSVYPDGFTLRVGVTTVVDAGCSGCHGANLEGGIGPNLQTIGTSLVATADLPAPPSGLAQMQQDYDTDPRMFLEKWIRDSAGNYNGGNSTGMPPHPVDALSDSRLQALITFLLSHE